MRVVHSALDHLSQYLILFQNYVNVNHAMLIREQGLKFEAFTSDFSALQHESCINFVSRILYSTAVVMQEMERQDNVWKSLVPLRTS